MMMLSKPMSTSPTITDSTVKLKPKLRIAETKQALSPNQVVIINQNNTIATNLNLNNELFSSMSSSSSSSINQPTTDTDSLELVDDPHADVKYMKGYVNVIKERFARRSLNEKKLSDSNSSQGTIRLSISDYQKRKQQISANGFSTQSKTRYASVDYQRTRSVSPFSSSSNFKTINSESNSSKQHISLFNKNSNSISNKRQDDDQKSFNSLSSPSQSSSSSSPLSSNYSSPDDFKKAKTEIIKCTYLNEINKDELPKPNFVSSVKNLFEKQISTNSTDNLNSLNNNINTSNLNNLRQTTNKSKQRQSLIETLNSPTDRIIKSNIKKSVSIESLVDRLKQNGTLVYEHNEKENIEIQTQPEKSFNLYHHQDYVNTNNHNKPLSIVSLNTNELDDKALSFKERKEIFSKNSQNLTDTINVNNNSTTSNKSQNINTKRQKIELQIDLNNESSDYNLNDEDSMSSNSSKQDDESLQADTVLSVTDILNSATENQKNKKSKTPVKVVTFYGGEEIKDVKKLNIQTKPQILNQTSNSTNNNSNDAPFFEFIGAGIKLEKSNLVTTNMQQIKRKNGTSLRVNFVDTAETYEYPSYEFMLIELGIDPLTDPDYRCETDPLKNENQQQNGFSSFLPGRSFNLSSDLDSYKTNNDNIGYNKLGNQFSK